MNKCIKISFRNYLRSSGCSKPLFCRVERSAQERWIVAQFRDQVANGVVVARQVALHALVLTGMDHGVQSTDTIVGDDEFDLRVRYAHDVQRKDCKGRS